MDLDWLEDDIREAVKHFWKVRDGGNGVRGGKTLDPFIRIIEKAVHESGLTDAEVHTGKYTSQLPGYFRPHKAWDVVIVHNGKLIATIELKSQVGSIGNNFNNRSEEVLGSSIDLKTAIEENAFGEESNIFTGYLIVVEKSEKTLKTPSIDMKYFKVMEGFLLDESKRNSEYVKSEDGTYPRMTGISYLDRYDIMCKKLMTKSLYKAAALLAVPNNDSAGNYESLSPQTSILTFMSRLTAHCQVIAQIDKQQK